MKKTTTEILNLIGQAIYDKKGINILGLDVTGLSSITDYMVIAEGNVDRHVGAIGREVVNVLRENGVKVFHSDGFDIGEWVIIDFGHIVVHIFGPGLREKYCLEKLWPTCQIVDIEIDLTKPQFTHPVRHTTPQYSL
jgi:ribosome-associated protein